LCVCIFTEHFEACDSREPEISLNKFRGLWCCGYRKMSVSCHKDL
jgi:hypothetical protein